MNSIDPKTKSSGMQASTSADVVYNNNESMKMIRWKKFIEVNDLIIEK